MWLSLDSAITSRKLRTRSGNTPRGWWSTRTPGAGESCSRTLRYACTELEAPYNIVHNHVNFVNWHLRKRGRFCVFAVVKKTKTKQQPQNNRNHEPIIKDMKYWPQAKRNFNITLCFSETRPWWVGHRLGRHAGGASAGKDREPVFAWPSQGRRRSRWCTGKITVW